ncbi:MAG TPA: ADOP family duplicated permease [Vicinamibacterales bacterium]|nr:ADOP family duplicated permease [Vicinamibacterales bacterium]
MSPAPVLPRIAAALLWLASPPDDRPSVLADFEDAYAEQRHAGRGAALCWCAIQVALSIPPLLVRRLRVTRTPRTQGASMAATFLTDVRYAARLARRAPLVALSTIAAIAGGIAAATAVVSVMESVFLRPLPFARPDELVQLSTIIERFGSAAELNYLDADDIRSQAATLDGVAQYDAGAGTLRVHAGEPAQSVTVLSVDRHLASVLRVAPALGRSFESAEFVDGGPDVVMLTNRFWRERFGGDPAIVGASLEMGSGPAMIVGVLPPAADWFPSGGSDLWTPLTFPATSFLNQRGSIALSAIGRLHQGATLDSAQAELGTIARRLATAYPETNAARRFGVSNLQRAMVGPVRPMMLLLAGAIAALLAIACANIASLLLAHAHERAGEFALRAAIGASHGRLARQLWTETLLLFSAAGGLGAILAGPLARILVARYPGTLPLSSDVSLDVRVMTASLLLTLAAAFTAGLPTIRRSRQWRIGAALARTARGSSGRSTRRGTGLFVSAQVALSIVLLFGGFVLLRTFTSMASVAPGFDPDGVVTIRATIPARQREDAQRMVAVQDQLRDAAASLPGVAGAAHAMFIPFAPGSWGDGYRRAGSSDAIGPNGPFAHFFMVSPEYFRVMHVPIVRGRPLTAADDEGGRRVVVVNQSFALRTFPDRDAIGGRIDWNDDVWEIVGIAGNARHESLWDDFDPDVYVPRHQVPRGNTWLLIASARPASALVAELQQRARAIDPAILLSDAEPMRQRLADSAAPERFRAAITSTLALIALGLALVGLNGVVAYSVVTRTKEIGIRLALGERPAAVRRGVVGDALRALAGGLIPGTIASWIVGRWLVSASLVRTDLRLALAAVACAFVVAGAAVAAGPAWRASRVDPVDALRHD